MLPHIERQYRLEPARDRVTSIGFLGDDEGAAGGCRQPHPPGPEQADALGDKVRLERLDRAPLLLNLFFQMPGRAGHDGSHRPKLGEVQIMVQNLAGVVEESAFGLAHDLFEGFILQPAARKEAVEVVDIALQVLAVVKADGIGTDRRCQGIGRVRELDECEHMLGDGIILLFPMEFFIDGKPTRSGLSYPGKEPLETGQALRLRGIRTNLTIIIEDSQ